MFTCPNKDVHSIYLDNELPLEYMEEYEAHVKNCPKCQAQLSKLRGLNSLFAADSNRLSFSENDKNNSFNRLQARLSYKKVTHRTQELGKVSKGIVKDMFIGAAAAAVIAVILPLRQAGVKTPVQEFTPVARMSSYNLPTASVITDENLTNLVSFLGDEKPNTAELQAHNSVAAAVMPFGTAFVNPTSYNTEDSRVSLTSYDVFSPINDSTQQKQENQKGFFIHFSSPILSFEIGTEK